MPLGLGLILLILVALLRAIVMPLYVIGDRDPVVRVRARRQLADLHARDGPARRATSSLEQFAFIFLVALGVDYNVFLLARIREERAAARATPRAP